METKDLVTAKTLAKLLKTSTNWVHTKRLRLPHIEIDGVTFYKIQECIETKPTLYRGPVRRFKNPVKVGGAFKMEKEDKAKLLAIKEKKFGTWTELIRFAVEHQFLNGKK